MLLKLINIKETECQILKSSKEALQSSREAELARKRLEHLEKRQDRLMCINVDTLDSDGRKHILNLREKIENEITDLVLQMQKK